jgi:branched-chain amino acid transport system substrate-binding protein
MLAENQRRPMIALSIVDKVVEGKRFVMKHWVPARAENELVLEEAARRGYRRIAVVSTQNDAMLLLRNLVRDAAAFEIALDEEFARDTADFRATCAKIRAAKPDAVYVLLWAPQPGIFARQLRDAGYAGPMFGVHNLEDKAEIRTAHGALNGAWFVSGDDRGASEYLADYESRFREPPTAGGVNAFDSAKMFIEGAGADDLNSYLHGLRNFEGALGRYGATPFNDFQIGAMLKQVDGDGFTSLPR